MINEIKYDYYSISLPHITGESNKNIITAVYQGRLNQPNISYNSSKMGLINYQAVELFISKGQHMYPQETTHDSELIILHRPTTNAPKLYSCFLLKQNSMVASTEIDDIIKHINTPPTVYKQEISLCMNTQIKKDQDGETPKMDIYEKKDKDGEPCIFVVFQDIIQISSEIDKKESKSIFENFTEKMTDNDDYLECEYLPGGIDTEEVQVYEIPIGSKVYTNGITSDWVTMVAMNLFVFMSASFAFFVYPLIYNFLKKKMDNDESLYILTIPRWKDIFILESMGSWYNLILTLLFFINSLILIILGFVYLSVSFFLSGLISLFSFVFGYMGISYLNQGKQTTTNI